MTVEAVARATLAWSRCPGPTGRALHTSRGSVIRHTYAQLCVCTTAFSCARLALARQSHAHTCPRQLLCGHAGPTHAAGCKTTQLRDILCAKL